MNCHTEQGRKVYAVVKRWMNAHPEVQGTWGVIEVQLGLDLIVSIHQQDGVRRLTLASQQVSTLTPEVEKRILDWLDNLSQQPVIKDADLSE